jgi:hypothetical protein
MTPGEKEVFFQIRTGLDRESPGSLVFTLLCDMNRLTFELEFFDLIWAEGYIYIIGVEKGFVQWRPFLRPHGFAAFTEVSWLRGDPPRDPRDFREEVYPAIGFRRHNEGSIRRAGYTQLDGFVLPENDWWNEDYDPIEKEIEIYRRYSAYYGYVFYIACKQRVREIRAITRTAARREKAVEGSDMNAPVD